MPSVSKKQHNFMEAVAHNPSFAKKAGVPQSVGKHFSSADKGKTFKRIGDAFSNKSPNRSYKSGGSVRSASSRADGCAIRGKTRA